MNKMVTTDNLRDRISKHAETLRNSGSRQGNVRGIGVEAMMDEAKKSKVSRNKARILKKMSPSLDRGLQILSGMIACPEGGVRTNLNYNVGTIKDLSEEKKNQLIAEISNFCDTSLDLENKLHDIVYKVISETGADVEVYIPMTLVDEVMGLESTGYIAESLPENKNPIEYSSNHLSFGNSMNLLTKTPIKINGMIGTESDKGGRNRISRINKTTLALSRDGIIGAESVIVRHTTGEAIIPIKYNGRVIKYVGILDELGNFVTSTDSAAFTDLMSQSKDTSESHQYEILSNDARLNANDGTDDKYKKIRQSIEEDVLKTLTGSKDTSGLDSVIESLGEENVLDILTARSMAAKKTRIIMIDPEYVSYFSLIENDHGRGITIIEDNSSIILLHVTLLYAKILSELDSSIPNTEARVTLDDNDADGEATLKDVMGELALSAAPDYNLDYSSNRELFRSLARVNTTVKVENANIPGMPNMDINVERTQKNVRGPSGDLLETVGKFATQTLGISSDHVDNSYSEKFKLQVSRDNDITSRQLMRYVSMVDESLTDRGRKRICHNDELWETLLKIIGGNNAEETLMEVMATLSIKLPEPTSNRFETFSTNMDIIGAGLEEYLNYAIPDTVMDNGERLDPDSLSNMREMALGAAIRSYAANSDLFGGLGIDITSMAGIANVIKNELEDYGDEFKGMVKDIRSFNKKMTKAEDHLNSEEEDEGNPPQDTELPEETSDEPEPVENGEEPSGDAGDNPDGDPPLEDDLGFEDL